MKSQQHTKQKPTRYSGPVRRRQDQRRSIAGKRDGNSRPQTIKLAEFERQYSLGMANYNNGLYERALKNFTLAASDPEKLVNCIIMGVHCHLKKGRLQKSRALLQDGLALAGLSTSEKLILEEEARKVNNLVAVFGLNPQVDKLKLSTLSQWELTPVAEWEYSAIAEWERSATMQWESYFDLGPAPESPTPEVLTENDIQQPKSDIPKADLYAAPTSKLITIPAYLLLMAVLIFGWQMRHDEIFIPEKGIGYQLGIFGSLLMLALLLYPLRKKLPLMRNWGSTRYWFKAHMLLGILGPALVLFHANFNTGSINSSVVLGCTLLVAGSGFFGRYLYTRIHYGLYGKRLNLKQLHREITANRSDLVYVFVYAPKLKQRLLNFEASVLNPPRGVLSGIFRVFVIDMRKRWAYLQMQLGLRRALKVTARRNDWSREEIRRQKSADSRLISAHLSAVLKVAELSFYERLFSLWHLFHLPLFLLLVIAGVIHVIAVHMY